MVAGSRTKGVRKSGGRLARRKRRLSGGAEQRQAAETEAARLPQEAAFDELVADFELAVEDEQAVAAAAEEVRRVRDRVRVAEARAVAARIVVAMGEGRGDGGRVRAPAGCDGGARQGAVELARDTATGKDTGAGATEDGEERSPGAGKARAAQEAAAGGEPRDAVRACGPAGVVRATAPPAGALSPGAEQVAAPRRGQVRRGGPGRPGAWGRRVRWAGRGRGGRSRGEVRAGYRAVTDGGMGFGRSGMARSMV